MVGIYDEIILDNLIESIEQRIESIGQVTHELFLIGSIESIERKSMLIRSQELKDILELLNKLKESKQHDITHIS